MKRMGWSWLHVVVCAILLSSGAAWGPLVQALAPPTDTGIAGGAGLMAPMHAVEIADRHHRALRGIGNVLPGLAARAVVHQCFHGLDANSAAPGLAVAESDHSGAPRSAAAAG